MFRFLKDLFTPRYEVSVTGFGSGCFWTFCDMQNAFDKFDEYKGLEHSVIRLIDLRTNEAIRKQDNQTESPVLHVAPDGTRTWTLGDAPFDGSTEARKFKDLRHPG